MPSDPYTTLGVPRSASADEVKRAYRKLAHQYHPDKKGGNEAKFKEVNEAYQILSDPDKKARYDSFGHAGAGFGGGQGGPQDFNFESIFDMFTGGMGGRAHQRPHKGEDLHLEVRAASGDLGKRKVYEFEAFNACGPCKGSGAKDGKLIACSACKGQGRVRQAVRTPFGTFAQVGACAVCEGDGQIPEKQCGTCGGTGRIKGKRTLEIHLPKALDDRHLIAFPREGNAGMQGTSAGDLLVTVRTR